MARDIKQLHPRLQAKVEELKALCKKEGLNIGIGECFRSVAEQDKLYAQGRTTPGSIVTNAKGSTYSSQHQWGIAFDFFKNVKGHEYDDIAFFNKVGALAKSIGLAWGGDWKNPVDKPHLYLGDWGSTTTKLKNQYGTFEKFKATWEAKSEDKPKTKTKKERILEWQKSAIADGFKFPKYGADGKWGAECEAVANKCIIKKRVLHYYPNTTRIVQRAVGVSVDGKCGKDTRAGIIAYQKKNGLVADGCVGLNTWKKILGV